MPEAVAEATVIDPGRMIRPGRTIEGISAVLLPFADEAGTVDWAGFRHLVEATVGSGLVPAVNMDTGYIAQIDDATRDRVLDEARAVVGRGRFVAGAFVRDRPGDPFDLDAYRGRADAIRARGGTPVLFPSFGLNAGDDGDVIGRVGAIARDLDRFIAFDLGTMFAPSGRIYGLAAYRDLMKIPACVGAKHSSLRREDEWRRLILRDQVRPDFRVYTGNDLAIDMVMYGSDYLLGLGTFAPDAFARRDALWAAGDPGFLARNDALQAIGGFAFRDPVPAYRHSAATFLALRGEIGSDAPHPAAPRRPGSDREILRSLLARLESLEETGG